MMGLTTMMRDLSNKLTRATGTLKDEIVKLRSTIGTTREQLQHVRRAPLPAAEVLAQTIPSVVREAAGYWLREYGDGLIRGDRSLATPNVTGSRDLPWSLVDPLPWAALCAGDPAGAARLLEGLLRAVPYDPGPPSAERPALIEQLAAQLAEMEAAEERIIDEAAEAGLVIEHRPEVIQRRNAEASARERTARADADREAREAAINEAHRRGRSGPRQSPYLQQERAERQALREG